MKTAYLLVIGLLVTSIATVSAGTLKLNGRYVATAYSQTGITASGQWTHRHVVAADPNVLPIGTRIKIKRAGRYSGEYVVADTGAKVDGRRLDLYVPSTLECKKFGVKRVSVKVLELGTGTHAAAKQADRVVKQDVKQDVAKGVVGNAATEHDWATQGAPVAKAVKEGGTPADATTAGTDSQRAKKANGPSANNSGGASANGTTPAPPKP
ncbi:MAG TPA: 3D domain-containing protein [Bryobacteraceae bacterium]|nr:3D domain-containing protein [Bryobacteraceae bacterium]